MMSGNRNLLWLLPLALLIASPVWLPVVADFLKPRGDFRATSAANDQQSNFTLEHLEFIQHSEGREDLRLQAARAQTLAMNAPIVMQKINATIIDKTGKTLILQGNEGLFDSKQQILTLSDSVKGTTTAGYNLSASALRYLNQQKRLESDQPVRLTGPNLEITAGNLSINTETNAFVLGGRVKVRSPPGGNDAAVNPRPTI